MLLGGVSLRLLFVADSVTCLAAAALILVWVHEPPAARPATSNGNPWRDGRLLVIPLLCLGAATVALGQVFLLGPPYGVVAGLADNGSRAGYLAAYGTCWGIAQTFGPLASTRLLSIGVPVAWLTGAALCVPLAALVPFADRAVTKAERSSARKDATT